MMASSPAAMYMEHIENLGVCKMHRMVWLDCTREVRRKADEAACILVPLCGVSSTLDKGVFSVSTQVPYPVFKLLVVVGVRPMAASRS